VAGRKKRQDGGPAEGVMDFRDDAPRGVSGMAWWDEDDSDIGPAMVETAKQVRQSPAEGMRQDFNLLYGSLFEGSNLTNLYAYGGRATLKSVSSGPGPAIGESTWNQIRAVILTTASQVARSKPRARFVTSGGNPRQKKRAKMLTKLVDGIFQLEAAYDKTQAAFVNAGAFDIAGIEVSAGLNRPELTVVLGTEVMIDANDGLYGNPRSLYRHKFVDKGVLLKTYGKTEEQQQAIRKCNTQDPTHQGVGSNLVEVWESWRLPSQKGAKDGKHVIAVEGEGGTLVSETWERDYFPLILFRWDRAIAGPYGRSAAEVLLPNQIAINTLLDKIQRAQHLACVPRVGIQRGSKVLKSELTNGIGSVVQFGSMPPVWWTPNALSPEVYQQLERHWARGFEMYGVSPQLASGVKASGTTSGEAIRESLDVQTARFSILSQRWEQFHLDIARAVVDTCRDLYADDPEKRIAAPGTELLEAIRWRDVDLEEDAYTIELYPTSLLPQTPQGRIDRVTDLVARGIWTPKRAEAALDDLDVDAAQNAARAAEKEAEQVCEDIVTDGKYRTPDPAMDLDALLRVASQYRASCELGDVPEKHKDLLYRLLDDAAALKAQMAPPPAPPGPAPAPQPQAAAQMAA